MSPRDTPTAEGGNLFSTQECFQSLKKQLRASSGVGQTDIHLPPSPCTPRSSIPRDLECHSYPKAFLSAIQPRSHQAAPAERRKKKERRKVRKASREMCGDPAAVGPPDLGGKAR